MMKKNETDKRHYEWWVLTAGIILTVLFGIYSTWESRHRAELEAEHTLEIYTARTESLLNSLFHKTDVLESIIITSNGAVPEETFNDLAKSLMRNQGIRAIQYLPEGRVKYCYPVEGNEKAIGESIFENPARREDALLAKNTREIALSGPYNLTQGGFGLVARNPIFLTQEDGTESFWGFSVIVLDLPDALNPLMLDELQREGFDYCLYTTVSGERVDIVGTEGFRARNTIIKEIEVPNHTWLLAVSPQKSWINYTALFTILFVGVGITGLCTIIVHMLGERNEQLKQYADTDALTGLVNRRKLLNYMELRCRDTKVPMAILFIDINDFKAINDTYGHNQGDILLREAGRRMKRYIASVDVAARMGGDEFVVVLEHCDTEGKCREQIRRLKEALGAPLKLADTPVELTASIGYALYPGEAADFQKLLGLADKRMYEEKKARK